MSRFSLNKIPAAAGIYALYEHDQCVFVGFSENLRERIEHHLIGAQPPEAGGMRSARLHPERVTEVCWWLDESFDDPARREAAWELAIQVLSPVLRPRFSLSPAGVAALEDHPFAKRMEKLLAGTPAGVFVPQTLDALARTILELEEKVEELEKKLAGGPA